MIFGHGIDIQTISQVKALAERQPNFIAKILTPAEQEEFNARVGKHRFEFLVGRYAAKEAYGKALGTGIGHGLGWQQLQIINDESGQPVFQMHPKQAELRAHLSISHTDDLVKASVILENLVTQEVSVSTHRPAWIEISALALAHNVDYIRKLTHAKRFVAVIKANAYGHGSAQIVTAALRAGVDAFAVATLDEGIWLRQFGVTLPIMILGEVEPQNLNFAVQNQLIVPVVSLAWLQAAQANLSGTTPLLVAVAVDTGMTRIGIRHADELKAVVKLIQTDQHFKLHSIGMHFATADMADNAYYEQQLQRWHALVDDLELPDDTWLHLANSATSLWHAVPSTDAIRVGAGMYGFDASQGALPSRDLQPVLQLKANLVQVKQVEAGTSVSYGATYTTEQPAWIGTVPIGYGDGYLRKLQGGYGLLPDGRHVQIVGRIAMDQLMVALPEAVPVGTTITLIGSVGNQHVTLEMLADQLETIPYEVATNLAARLPRYLID